MSDDAPPAARPRQRDLVSGAIGPNLLAFALPTLGSSILQSLNGSINAVWVGRFLGEDALAATSNANIVMFMVTAFVFGFSMATTILVGQCFGRAVSAMVAQNIGAGRWDRVSAITRSGVGFALLITAGWSSCS